MKLTNAKHSGRTCGLRLNATDAIVLLAAFVLTLYVRPRLMGWSWGFLIITLHFFLFCNVFRIRRQLEYLWSAIFLINVAFWSYGHVPPWHWILAIQTPITAFFIGSEMRLPWYQGVFARRLNPRLEEYLRSGEK